MSDIHLGDDIMPHIDGAVTESEPLRDFIRRFPYVESVVETINRRGSRSALVSALLQFSSRAQLLKALLAPSANAELVNELTQFRNAEAHRHQELGIPRGGEKEQLLSQYKSKKAIHAIIELFRRVYFTREFSHPAHVFRFCDHLNQDTELQNLLKTLTRSDPILAEAIHKLRVSVLTSFLTRYYGTRGIEVADPRLDVSSRTLNEGGGDRVRSREAIWQSIYDLLSLLAYIDEEKLYDICISLNLVTPEELPIVSDIASAYLGECAGTSGGPIVILGQRPEVLEVAGVRPVAMKILKQQVYDGLMSFGFDDPKLREYYLQEKNIEVEARDILHSLSAQAGVPPQRHQGLFRDVIDYFKQLVDLFEKYSLHETFIDEIVDEEGQRKPLPSLHQLMAVMDLRTNQHGLVNFDMGQGKTLVAFLLWHITNIDRQKIGLPPMQIAFITPAHVNESLPLRIRPDIPRVNRSSRKSAIQQDLNAGDTLELEEISENGETHETLEHTPTSDVGGAAQRHHYFREGRRPTVGVIEAGMNEEEITIARNQEILFCSMEMLQVPKGDRQVVDHLIDHRHWAHRLPFGVIAFDEAHKYKGNKTRTEFMTRLIHETPNLYREGHVLLLSGTPATRSLADLRILTEALEEEIGRHPEQFNWRRVAMGSEIEAAHPGFLRNMLTHRLINYENRMDWRAYCSFDSYELSRPEQEFVEMIIQDNTLHVMEKIMAIALIIPCPRLVSEDPRMPQTLLSWVKQRLREYLFESPNVVIFENFRRIGIFEGIETSTEQEFATFASQIQRWLEEWAQEYNQPVPHFGVIHSGVKKKSERRRLFDLARQSDEAGLEGRKTVIFTMRQCMDHGIDAPYLHRMIGLEPDWVMEMMAQMIMRGALRRRRRNDSRNVDFHASVFCANRTPQAAALELAQDRNAIIRACLDGGYLTESQIREHATEEDMEGGVEVPVAEQFDSDEQKWNRTRRALHGKGMKNFNDYWRRRRDRWAIFSKLKEETGIGDEERGLAGFVVALERWAAENERLTGQRQYLHVHSQECSLDRWLHIIAPDQDRQIVSVHPMDYVLESGHRKLVQQEVEEKPRLEQGNLADIHPWVQRGRIQQGQFHAAIIEDLEFAHSDTQASGDVHMTERRRALLGAVRSVREGGYVIVKIPRKACRREEFRNFCADLRAYGCFVIDSWSGEVTSMDNEGDSATGFFIAVGFVLNHQDANDLRENLSGDSLQFTHFENWPETSEKQQVHGNERRRKLPYWLLHNQYQVTPFSRAGISKTFSVGRSEKHEEQVTYLHALQNAVAAIRTLAPTVSEFRSLPEEARKKVLQNHGMEYLTNLFPKKLAFRFIGNKHFFYPYDRCWEVTES